MVSVWTMCDRRVDDVWSVCGLRVDDVWSVCGQCGQYVVDM